MPYPITIGATIIKRGVKEIGSAVTQFFTDMAVIIGIAVVVAIFYPTLFVLLWREKRRANRHE